MKKCSALLMATLCRGYSFASQVRCIGMDLFGIKEYLDRAKALLASSEQHQVRYACLELRFCFEKVAYRQLAQYGNEIPSSVVREWRPDHVLKLLASFDPQSDQPGILSIGMQSSPDEEPTSWSTVGESKLIPWRKFRSHYNKLGSYLHQPVDGSSKDIKSSSLDKIIADLDSVMASSIILATKRTINAICDCGQEIFIGETEFEDDELIKCAGKNCGRYWSKKVLDSGEQVLQAAASIFYKCTCSAIIRVLPEDVWKRFTCNECSVTYRLNLGYSAVAKV